MLGWTHVLAYGFFPCGYTMSFNPSVDTLRLLLSLWLSLLVGGLGYWRHSLTRGGWLGAVLVGTATAGLGGWSWGVLVVVFFITSSALSHWRRAAKERQIGGSVAKGSQRDLLQTLANGGVPAALAVVSALQPSSGLFAAAVGAIATVTADTWATEIGTLSVAPPRLITSGRRVSPGTSGGVSGLGLCATAIGALLIGVVALATERLLGSALTGWIVAVAFVSGIGGAITDSVMGATIQRLNRCPRCQVDTERDVHSCGAPTKYRRGLPWLDNDWVNFLSSVAGAGISTLVWALVA